MPKKGEHIQKRKDGRWEGHYRNGAMLNGKSTYCSVYGKSSSKVKKKLFSCKKAKTKIVVYPKKSVLFRDIVFLWYKANVIRYKGATAVKYENLINNHVAENTLDTKDKEISFGVDKTKPNIVVTNLESGKTYPLEGLTVSMSVNDNLLLESVTVYLDNYDKAYKSWNAEEIANILEGDDSFEFYVAGDSTGAHNVKIVCTDAAGNEQVEEITDFYVTTNLFVRYYNNKVLFFGTIGGVILVAGLVVALVVIKKKKQQA